jgi:8-oxo-dGTP pyrophosphatase MutT (NUDIX family)
MSNSAFASPNLRSIKDTLAHGLIRGSAKMPYDPEKAYFYVEHPDFTPSGGTQGWRVYLRAACFIQEKAEGCVDFLRFLVVKRTGKPANGKEWEPPKGQMEGKDGLAHPRTSIINLLRENVKREVYEEARVKGMSGLEYTGLVFESRESDYPPNTFFQYHIFRAQVSPRQWMAAASELDWCRAHPAAHARMTRDKREKDALAWYSPTETKIMGRWSPKIVTLYLKNML